METGEEARLASQLMELPSDASVSFLKRRLERISFGGHQLASSQQVCPGPRHSVMQRISLAVALSSDSASKLAYSWAAPCTYKPRRCYVTGVPGLKLAYSWAKRFTLTQANRQATSELPKGH